MPGNPAASRLDAPFVGRRAELAVLEAAFARAAGGLPTVALVSGEPGIGKSSLVHQLVRHAEQREALVRFGACVELSVPVPYLPLTDLLRPLLADAASGHAEGAPQSAELARARLFDGVLGLVSSVASERPAVIVVDDLQWADRSTLDILRFLVRSVRAERLLLVLTCRSPAAVVPTPARDALADIARSPRTVVLELAGLEPPVVGELLAALLGRAPDPEVAADVARRTHGSPFFVEWLAEHADSGVDRLPERLRDVVLASTEGLSATALTTLDALAVGGGAIAHDTLAAIVETSVDDLDDALRAAVERRLVRVDEGAYAIRHALLREALAERLLPGELRRLHRALAEQLELRGGTPGVLAHHWRAAGVPERAFPAAVTAGRAASASCAAPEAHDHFEAALALRERLPAEAEAGVEPDELLALTAEAAAGAGRFDAAAHRFREALEATRRSPEERAVLHVRLAYALFRIGDVPGQIETMRRAAELVEPLPASAARSGVLATVALTRAISRRDASGRPLAEQALADARAVGARAEEGRALIALGTILDVEGRVDDAIASLYRARDIALEVAAEEDAARAALNLTWLLGNAGRCAEAVAAAESGTERARAAGLERAFATMLRANAVNALMLAGELAQASALAARPIPPANDVWAAVTLLARRAWVSQLLGEDELARAALARAQDLAGSLPSSHPLRADVAQVAALVALESGDVAAALEGARAAAAQVEPNETLSLLEICCVGARAAADAALRAGALRREDEAEAARRDGRTLVDRGLALGRRPDPRERAVAALLAAEASRLEGRPGASLWREAVAAWDRVGPGPSAGYASFRLAEALADARAPAAEVRAAATDALERARTLGMPRLEAAVAGLARRRRVALPAAAGGGADRQLASLGLTRRELEVLRHLADGKTNRRIATELVISEKTAGHHVSSILAKLGVRTRGEAAAVALRLGLDPADEPARS